MEEVESFREYPLCTSFTLLYSDCTSKCPYSLYTFGHLSSSLRSCFLSSIQYFHMFVFFWLSPINIVHARLWHQILQSSQEFAWFSPSLTTLRPSCQCKFCKCLWFFSCSWLTIESDTRSLWPSPKDHHYILGRVHPEPIIQRRIS